MFELRLAGFSKSNLHFDKDSVSSELRAVNLTSHAPTPSSTMQPFCNKGMISVSMCVLSVKRTTSLTLHPAYIDHPFLNCTPLPVPALAACCRLDKGGFQTEDSIRFQFLQYIVIASNFKHLGTKSRSSQPYRTCRTRAHYHRWKME